MQGIQRTFLPDQPEFFLLVRINLKEGESRADFERRGAILRPVFEQEIGLHLMAGARILNSDGGGEDYINFWRMESPAQLLDAMSRVHDIKEYGPVDDMIRLETQDLMSAFVTQTKDMWPAPPSENAKPYYVMAEYDTPSGKAGTLAFDLEAYLGNFEQRNNWDCFATCFPMTGPLPRYVQFFRFWSEGKSDEEVYKDVQAKLNAAEWGAPKGIRVMAPARYDRCPAAAQALGSSGGGGAVYSTVPVAASPID